MSTDLQFRQDQPRLRLPAIIIDTITLDHEQIPPEIQCTTPTSPQHKIPPILVCPPAPKKHNTVTISSKRKLRELDFFETVARDEIDCFFKTVVSAPDQLLNSKSDVKRRRSCL